MSRRLRPALLLLAVGAATATTVVGVYAAFSSSTGNPANSFQAANNFCTRSWAVWLTGMEHGVVSTSGGGIFNTLVTTGGTPTADSVTVRNGSYSLGLDKTLAGASYALRTFTASSVVVVRLAVRLSALPAADVGLAFVDSGTDLVLGYDSASQKLELTLGASTATSSGTVSAGTWYVVDLRYDMSANPHRADWRVNEVSETQVTLAAAATTANGVGFGSTTAGHVFTANYDDIFVSTTPTAYPLGDGKIVRLLPNGMGTHVNSNHFQDDDGSAVDANSYTRVDDVPMTSTLDHIRQVTNGAGSYIELTWENTAETCIREVSAVLAYTSAGAASNNGKTSIFDGSTETVVYSGDMSETSLFYKSAIVTPAAAPWTQSTVDGLLARIGFSSDRNPNPQWQSVLLELAVPL